MFQFFFKKNPFVLKEGYRSLCLKIYNVNPILSALALQAIIITLQSTGEAHRITFLIS